MSTKTGTTTWRWTADSFERAGEAGIFGDTHADLIDGEVHIMSPRSPLHANVLRVITAALATLQPGYVANVQLPIRLADDTEPEPDFYIAAGTIESYTTRHPGPDDVLLVVEVSVSTLTFDTGTKLRAYARAGLPQLWVIDVDHRRARVYSSPDRDECSYKRVVILASGTLEAFGLQVAVAQLWPPEA